MGAIVTLVVLAASMLIGGDPAITWPVIAGLYAMGLAIGLANGLIVSFLKVPSIIATLGTMLLVNGLALAWSGGAPRGDLPDNFRNLGRLVLRDVPLVGVLPIAVIILVGARRWPGGGCMRQPMASGCWPLATIRAQRNSPVFRSNRPAFPPSSFPRYRPSRPAS